MTSHLILDAWRGNLAELNEHINWIARHRETLEQGTERQEYLDYCQRRLNDRLRAYLICLRRVSEAEAELAELGDHLYPEGRVMHQPSHYLSEAACTARLEAYYKKEAMKLNQHFKAFGNLEALRPYLRRLPRSASVEILRRFNGRE